MSDIDDLIKQYTSPPPKPIYVRVLTDATDIPDFFLPPRDKPHVACGNPTGNPNKHVVASGFCPNCSHPTINMKYTTKKLAYFTVNGQEYQFDTGDLALGEIVVEETAKNGQEDTHYQGGYYLEDDIWVPEIDTNDYGHNPKAIARFLTKNPYDTPIFDDELDGMITNDGDLALEDFYRAIEITRNESTSLHGYDYEPTLSDLITNQ